MEDSDGLARLAFFSDAVFAIAITLLALDIRLPARLVHGAGSGALASALFDLWPQYISFLLSFLVIGNFWIAHHLRFRLIERYDMRYMLFNLLQLMAIAFIPFPTSVLAESGNRTATIFYALTIAVTGLISALMWWYATSGNRLVDDLGTRFARRHLASILTVPGVFLLSVAVALINADLAKVSWFLTVPAALAVR